MINRHFVFFLTCLTLLAWSDSASSESRVYLTNGETRLGFTTVRFGRVTVKSVDRLYQHPEEAVHRIEHVTGETTLIGREGILLREQPEKLSKTLIAIPKGCEVKVLEVEGDWVKIQVFAGRDEAIGYLHTEDLSDEVLFNFVNPTIRFKAPPTNLRDMVDREAIRRNMRKLGRLTGPSEETDFTAEPSESEEPPSEPESPEN